MKGTLLDTSAYSALLRGHAVIAEALRAVDEVVLSVVVLGELRAGFRRGAKLRENDAALARFLAEPRVRVVDVDEETAERYAVIHADLRSRGTPIPINDVWIAASAFQHGLRVLTMDADFCRVAQILVDHVTP